MDSSEELTAINDGAHQGAAVERDDSHKTACIVRETTNDKVACGPHVIAGT